MLGFLACAPFWACESVSPYLHRREELAGRAPEEMKRRLNLRKEYVVIDQQQASTPMPLVTFTRELLELAPAARARTRAKVRQLEESFLAPLEKLRPPCSFQDQKVDFTAAAFGALRSQRRRAVLVLGGARSSARHSSTTPPVPFSASAADVQARLGPPGWHRSSPHGLNRSTSQTPLVNAGGGL